MIQGMNPRPVPSQNALPPGVTARVRRSVRAVLVSDASELLLLQIQNPTPGGWNGWITPGGGPEAGEDDVSALRRELFEELGLEKAPIGPLVWNRVHFHEWNGEWIEGREAFYLVRVATSFLPEPQQLTEAELRDLKGMRWWSAAELKETDREFAPRRLPELFEEILKNGSPSVPVETGV